MDRLVQTYKYDAVSRLTEAREKSGAGTGAPQTWKETYGYDRYGNRTSHANFEGTNQFAPSNITDPAIDPNTNRFNTGQGYGYDLNGNLISDAEGRAFTFNADNKQTKVTQNGQVVGEYFFDGEGKRVKKVTATETTVFVYSNGKLIAEYSTAPPPQNPTTSYIATDQLGSPRVLTDAMGNVVSRRDFRPFGEEVTPDGTYRTANLVYTSTDNIRQKFTGYQKDAETGLDFAEARMYENRYGRFTAVDPLLASGKSADPQSFNRYVYCLDNPANRVDRSGLQSGTNTGYWTFKDEQSSNSETLRTFRRANGDNPDPGFTPWKGNDYYIFKDFKVIFLGDGGGSPDARMFSIADIIDDAKADLISTQASQKPFTYTQKYLLAYALSQESERQDIRSGHRAETQAAAFTDRERVDLAYYAMSTNEGQVSDTFGIGPFSFGLAQGSPRADGHSYLYPQFSMGKVSPIVSFTRTFGSGEPEAGLSGFASVCTTIGPCGQLNMNPKDLLQVRNPFSTQGAFGSPSAGVGVTLTLPGFYLSGTTPEDWDRHPDNPEAHRKGFNFGGRTPYE